MRQYSKENTPHLWVFLLPYSASIFFHFYHLETPVVLELCVVLRISANQNSCGDARSLVTLSISVGQVFVVCFSDCYSGLSSCSYYHNPKTALYTKKFINIFLCASFCIYLHHVPVPLFCFIAGKLVKSFSSSSQPAFDNAALWKSMEKILVASSCHRHVCLWTLL